MMMKPGLVRSALLTAALASACPAAALARSTSVSLHVGAVVTANCVLKSTGVFDFGTYESGQQAPLKVSEKVLSIACTKKAPGVHIGLSNGLNFSKHLRNLVGPHHELVAYQIYTTAKEKRVWNEHNKVGYKPKSDRLTPITMYGVVLPRQDVRSGKYQDALVATVNF